MRLTNPTSQTITKPAIQRHNHRLHGGTTSGKKTSQRKAGKRKNRRDARTGSPRDIHLRFKRRVKPTIGLEAEFMLQRISDGSPANVYDGIVRRLPRRMLPCIHPETFSCQIEVVTPICRDANHAVTQLQRRIDVVAEIAAKCDARLLWKAMPNPDWLIGDLTPNPSPRLQQMTELLGGQIGMLATCGLHIHIAVDRKAAISVIDRMQRHIPQLAALTANSPGQLESAPLKPGQSIARKLKAGQVKARQSTKSLRVMRYANQFPVRGFPHHFGDWAGWYRQVDRLYRMRVVKTQKDIYHFIRPTRFGTLEFRFCDLPPRLSVIYEATERIHGLVRSAMKSPERIERPDLGSLASQLREQLSM